MGRPGGEKGNGGESLANKSFWLAKVSWKSDIFTQKGQWHVCCKMKGEDRSESRGIQRTSYN